MFQSTRRIVLLYDNKGVKVFTFKSQRYLQVDDVILVDETEGKLEMFVENS